MRGSLALAVSLLAFAGCTDPGVDLGPRPDYDPGVTAADFVAGIDNPWLPYPVGATWRYEAETEDGTETIDIEVLAEKRTIMGVQATVVRDTVRLEGELVEDTYDWFAQDASGNVWYLGEDTCEYEGGKCVDHHGAWEWGKDGALPGIIMWADPVANNTPYYQEFYWSEAIDQAAVIATGRGVTVPAGTFTDTVSTREWNPNEPGVEEEADYARGIGAVRKTVTMGDEKGQAEILVSYHLP